MLGFLKRLVGSKRSAEQIPFSTIELWLDKQLKDTDLSPALAGVFNDITQSVTIISAALRKITQKLLKNEVSAEHIALLEEHREEFLSKLHEFVKQAAIDKKDVESVLNYSETLTIVLKNIKEDVKSHLPAIEKFFPEQEAEIDNALEDLKEFNSELNDLIKHETGVYFIYDVKKKIQSIRKKQKTAAELKEQIEREKLKEKEAEEYKLKLETDVDNLKTGYEYEKHDALLSKKLQLEKEIEREAQGIKLKFAPLSKMLSRYDGVDAALAKAYSKDAINALHNDKGLFIINLLQGLALRLPEIEQDEQKRMKLREIAAGINGDLLRSYLAKHDSVKESLDQLKRQLALDTTTMKLEDIKYKLNHVQEQIAVSRENRKKHENTISELNIEKDLLMLEKKLSILAPVKLT